jgi:uncharacterized protein YecT (DUF1311 family)
MLIVLLAAAAAAAPVDCVNALTQRDMNWCAAEDFRAADAALNAQWAITAAAMKRADKDGTAADGRIGYHAALLAAQRAWLAFRDAQCVSEGYAARGGSMEPMLVANCKAELTRERTQQLAALVEAD